MVQGHPENELNFAAKKMRRQVGTALNLIELPQT